MDTNDTTTLTAAPVAVIELGVASIETKGPAGINEFVGTLMGSGISDE